MKRNRENEYSSEIKDCINCEHLKIINRLIIGIKHDTVNGKSDDILLNVAFKTNKIEFICEKV